MGGDPRFTEEGRHSSFALAADVPSGYGPQGESLSSLDLVCLRVRLNRSAIICIAIPRPRPCETQQSSRVQICIFVADVPICSYYGSLKVKARFWQVSTFSTTCSHAPELGLMTYLNLYPNYLMCFCLSYLAIGLICIRASVVTVRLENQVNDIT